MALTSLQARVESHRSASTSSVAAARDCRHRNHGATFHWAAGLPRLGLLPAAILLHNRASLESSICVSARDSGVISASGSSGDTAHEVPTLKKSKPRSATPANGGQQSPPTRSKRRSQTSDLSAGVIISRNSAKSARPGGAGQGTAQEGQTLAGRGELPLTLCCLAMRCNCLCLNAS